MLILEVIKLTNFFYPSGENSIERNGKNLIVIDKNFLENNPEFYLSERIAYETALRYTENLYFLKKRYHIKETDCYKISGLLTFYISKYKPIQRKKNSTNIIRKSCKIMLL